MRYPYCAGSRISCGRDRSGSSAFWRTTQSPSMSVGIRRGRSAKTISGAAETMLSSEGAACSWLRLRGDVWESCELGGTSRVPCRANVGASLWNDTPLMGGINPVPGAMEDGRGAGTVEQSGGKGRQVGNKTGEDRGSSWSMRSACSSRK